MRLPNVTRPVLTQGINKCTSPTVVVDCLLLFYIERKGISQCMVVIVC